MNAIVRIGEQFGNRVVHPVNTTACLFADIAGTKVLTPRTLRLMAGLGVQIEVEQTEEDALRTIMSINR